MVLKMTNVKIITLFNTNEKIPFMTCVVKYVEENGHGIKLFLENGIISMLKITILSSCLNQQMIVIRSKW